MLVVRFDRVAPGNFIMKLQERKRNKKMAVKVNLGTVFGAVLKKEDFICNKTMSGMKIRPGIIITTGRLPVEFHEEFKKDCDAQDFYVVVSYATPIAWFANGMWRVPDVKYSHSTSRHLASTRIQDGKTSAGRE